MENKLFNENSFQVVGRLVSADVKLGNRTTDGASYVSVDAVVTSIIEGVENEYPISFYANELTKDNKHSKLYDTYAKMGELIGKKVDISGSIRENRFWSANANQLVSSQQLSGMWVKGVVDTAPDKGTFTIGGFLGATPIEKRNKEDEVYRYDVVVGQSNYNGDNMNRFILHIHPENREVINGIESIYQVGDTIKLDGNLSFIVKEETVTEQVGFGKPVQKVYTNKQKNFYITGGSETIQDERAYTGEVIKKLKAAYDARDVELMNNQKKVETSTPTPVSTNTTVSKRQASLI